MWRKPHDSAVLCRAVLAGNCVWCRFGHDGPSGSCARPSVRPRASGAGVSGGLPGRPVVRKCQEAGVSGGRGARWPEGLAVRGIWRPSGAPGGPGRLTVPPEAWNPAARQPGSLEAPAAQNTPWPSRKHPAVARSSAWLPGPDPCAHHTPMTLHHSGPTASQIAMWTSPSTSPVRHHTPSSTYPEPKYSGAGPLP